MERQQLFELYEKSYYHEVEMKEKILGRLQIPLAILLTFASGFIYIIKSIDLNKLYSAPEYFLPLLIISLLGYIVSLVYFIFAFFGHIYQLLPTAQDTEIYRSKLIEHFKEYSDSKLLVSNTFYNYLNKYYYECSSHNSIVNDKRSRWLHLSNSVIVLMTVPFAATLLIFNFSEISKSNNDTEYKVKITNSIPVIQSVTSEQSLVLTKLNVMPSKDKEYDDQGKFIATATATAKEID